MSRGDLPLLLYTYRSTPPVNMDKESLAPQCIIQLVLAPSVQNGKTLVQETHLSTERLQGLPPFFMLQHDQPHLYTFKWRPQGRVAPLQLELLLIRSQIVSFRMNQSILSDQCGCSHTARSTALVFTDKGIAPPGRQPSRCSFPPPYGSGCLRASLRIRFVLYASRDWEPS